MNKIKTTEPKVLWKLRCKLGEGTLWVKEHNSIYFVDIKKKKFFSLNIKNNKKKIYKVNKEIGFVAHVEGHIFILGLQGELRIQNINTKKILKKIPIEKNIKLNRINDGKTDPNGNLWFGTMDNLERNIEKGSLYKLDKNLLLTKVDTNYRITNGPAFIDQYNFYYFRYSLTTYHLEASLWDWLNLEVQFLLAYLRALNLTTFYLGHESQIIKPSLEGTLLSQH